MSHFIKQEKDYYVVFFDETHNYIQQKSIVSFECMLENLSLIPEGDVGVMMRANTSLHPFNKCGFLAFKSGNDYSSASGQFVDNKRFILTCGHCVYDYDSKLYSTTVRFSRAMLRDAKSHDAYVIKAAIIPRKWVDSGDRRFDYAIVITDRPTAEVPLSYDIYGARFGVDVLSVGYPMYINNSYTMWYVKDTVNADEIRPELYFLNYSKNMGKGSSGGAWMTYINDKYDVIGLNAARLDNTTYSPKLDESFKEMFSVSKEVLQYMEDVEQGNFIRFFVLDNDSATILEIQVIYETQEECGTKVCFNGDNICTWDDNVVVDLTKLGIPDGAKVRIKMDVCAGFDNTAKEEFEYSLYSTRFAHYKFTGTTIFGNTLTLKAVDDVKNLKK